MSKGTTKPGTLAGRLVARGRGDRPSFTGHSVEALVEARGAKNAPATVHHLRAAVEADGRFALHLPADDLSWARADLTIRAPSGRRLATAEAVPGEAVEIPVAGAGPVALEAVEADPAADMRELRVTLRAGKEGQSLGDRLVLAWAQSLGADAAAPELSVVSAETSDASGRARLLLPAAAFERLELEILGKLPAGRIPVELKDGVPATGAMEVTAAFEDSAPQDGAAEPACACDPAPVPRTPDHADLVEAGNLFSQDPNGGDCVKLAVPNRTIEEYSFYSLVRTTDPVLWQPGKRTFGVRPLSPRVLEMAAQIAFGADGLDQSLSAATSTGAQPRGTRRKGSDTAAQDGLRLASEAWRTSGLIAARAWRDATEMGVVRKAILDRASALSETTLRQALSDPDGFTPVTLMTAERKAAIEEMEAAVTAAIPPGRPVLGKDNQIAWENFPRFSQAATISHGQLLEFRQQWKADGYSLGDLLYSLPLAPGQKRRMVVVDWDRGESRVRDESRRFEEDFDATLTRDRDVAEIVNSTVTESLRGGSSANTWGAGGGIGLGIPVGPGFLGIGVAGGAGGASSEAWQNSARGLAASTAQNLSDRTQQAAAAVRSQRSTVVTSQRQSEAVSVTSEVVANYNHCHAMTIEYFEVLKHYRVDQVLTDAREVLFVPLEMAPFDDLKALRWQDALEPRLSRRALAPGFDAIHRIQTNYVDADFPAARYADELVREIWGELNLELNFARPRDPQEGEDIDAYLNSAWSHWALIFGSGSARAAYQAALAGQALADRIFADELAPQLARAFCDGLRLELRLSNGGTIPLTADMTMVARYRPGREHLVTFRVVNPPAVRRTDIRGIGLASDLQFAPGSRTILRFANVSYRNPYRIFPLVAPRRVADDVRPNDPAFLSARWLSRGEEFNPRENDRELRANLLKHLNEHVERYHQLIWWLMDAGRRFMLLDGFTAPFSDGRSVASVTENRLINIVGNSLVLPVAPGVMLDPTIKREDDDGKPIDLLSQFRPKVPIPPRRISVPTRGVYAEAVMGSCNSCERTEDSRFWRWEEEPTGLEPTGIATVDTGSRREAPLDTKPTDFPDAVVAVQAAPAAPAITDFNAIATLLGQKDLFKDVSGLAQNQANALGAFKEALQTADAFGKLAAAGARTVHAQRNSKNVMDKVDETRAAKQLSDDDAKHVTKKLFGLLNGDQGTESKPLGEEEGVAEAVEKTLKGKGDKKVTFKSETGNTSQSAEVEIKDQDQAQAAPTPAIDAKVSGDVPLILQQGKSKGCWAAALTMLLSWKEQRALTIPEALAGGGDDYVAKFEADTGLLPNEVEAFRTAFGLKDASVRPLTASALATLLKEAGPLWVIGDQDPGGGFSFHARVVIAVKGNGKPASTTVTFHDPSSSGPRELSLRAFIEELDQLSDGTVSAFGTFSPQILSL